MSGKKDSSISRAGFADDVGAKRFHGAFRIMPAQVRADHYNDNHDRAAIYKLSVELPELAGHPAFADDRFCFRRAVVLARVQSFVDNDQQEPIKVYRSATGRADVAAGFLRHAAALYMEVTGALAALPKTHKLRDGLLVTGEEAPADQATAVGRNHAENEREATTDVDRAWLCRRYEALGMSKDDMAAKLGVSSRMVARYLQLLLQPPQVLLDVHEGRRSMMAVLNEASQKGRHGGRGARKGASVAGFARALEYIDARPLPKVGLKASDLRVFLALLAGEAPDNVPDNVREVFDAFQPNSDEIKALREKAKSSAKDGEKRNPKGQKAPLKLGEKAQAEVDKH